MSLGINKKNVFDFIIAIIILILLTPIILVIAFLVRINIGSPVFFRQERPGFQENPFIMIKFRTMQNVKDKEGIILSDEKRLTMFGKFLRTSSLDELPELWNVIKGDMSLVGPRPLLMEYITLYNDEQRRRHNVRPGITGWAQINGRNAITWDEKFKLDVWYVDNWSILLDIKILFLTIIKVFKSEGISQKGHVTMEKFKGSKN